MEDHLDDFETLFENSQNYCIKNPIENSHTQILEKLSQIKEKGVTALGPALVVG